MSEAIVTLNDQSAETITIHVPRIGVWWADVDMVDEASGISGGCKLKIGDSTFVGTVDPNRNDTFGLRRRLRVIGGAAGWGKLIASKAYHNDAGVKASLVVQDAAKETGETIGSAIFSNDRIGADYVRPSGTAGRVIDDVTRGDPWWVGYDGKTNIGPRVTSSPAKDSFTLLEQNPRSRQLRFSLDSVQALGIGSLIHDERLSKDLTITSLELVIRPGEIRAIAHYDDERDPLIDALGAVVRQFVDERLTGHFRYRVINMAGDRVNVQCVRKLSGVPDLLAISMWPGVAGAHSILSPGAEVLVEFIEGDRTQPMITHFAGKDGVGHVPVTLELCGNAFSAARMGDLVESGGPGLQVVLQPIGGIGAPPNNAVVVGVPHFLTFSPVPLLDVVAGTDAVPLNGAITTGSDHVKLDGG